jgi:hypothetical protein
MCTDRRYCCCNSALNPCGADQDDDVPPLDVDDEQLVDGCSGIVIVRMSRELAAGEAKRHRGDAIGVAEKLFERRFNRSRDGGMTAATMCRASGRRTSRSRRGAPSPHCRS